MAYDGRKNLIPMNQRPPEEREAILKKAHEAAARNRTRRKKFKTVATWILGADAPEAVKAELEALGMDSETTVQAGIALAMAKNALAGDVKSAQFLIDSVGENPRIEIQREELKIKRELLAREQESGNGVLVELIADLKESGNGEANGEATGADADVESGEA